jgi:3'-phosphoadenosine 5'-phosphosulfate sulfotransferase (PAPS reductase)/FAD synthetase
MTNSSEGRHILSLSGGKDSTALAVYMRDRVPDMEYVFCDTGKELPETYEYLNIIEAFLGKPIVRLNSEFSFDHWLKVYSGFLPSAQMRWCTKTLKLKPFERYCGDELVYSYVGIRADENRSGYISHKPNIKPLFPFKEDGITKADVFRILDEAGLGLPEYYKWRTRSGCYFCFFQRKAEWVGLKENHPDLFEKAKTYEKAETPTGARYTWQQGESLDELAARSVDIKKNHETMVKRLAETAADKPLIQVFDEAHDEFDEEEAPCLICEL